MQQQLVSTSLASPQHPEPIGCLKPGLSTDSVFEGVKAAIQRWQANFGAHLSAREFEHLSTSITANVGLLAPKCAPENPKFRAFYLPRGYGAKEEAPGSLIFINKRGLVGFYESHNRFKDISTHSMTSWSEKISDGLSTGETSRKRLVGFSPLPLPAEWSTLESKPISSFCRALAARIKLKGMALRISSLSRFEDALPLAAEVSAVIKPHLTNALEFALYGEDPHYHPVTEALDKAQNPVEYAANLSNQEQRLALVQWLFSAPCFAGTQAPGDRAAHKTMLSTVTSRQPFIREASRIFDCAAPLISRLREGSLDSIKRTLLERSDERDAETLKATGVSAHVVIRFLSKIPLSNVPQFNSSFPDSREFKSFTKLFMVSLDLAFPERSAHQRNQVDKQSLRASASLLALESLGASTRGQWIEQASLMTSEKRRELSHARDMINAVSRVTLFPRLILDRAENAPYTGDLPPADVLRLAQTLTLAVFARETSLTGLIKLSTRWHRAGILPTSNSNYAQSWGSIVPEQVAPNGCKVVPLTSSAELSEEGGAMHHCVGGYGAYCSMGESQIFSIRDQNGERLSTLELRLGKGNASPTVSVRQNHAKFNKQAPPEATAAANWLVESINSGKLEAHIADVGKVAAAQQATSLCGFDPRDSEVWQREFNGVRAFLPSRISAPTPQEFLAQTKFDNLTRQLLRMRTTLGLAAL